MWKKYSPIPTHANIIDAIKSDDVNGVKVFLGKDADVNQTDEFGCTLLYKAILSESVKVMEYLSKRGGKIVPDNITTEEGNVLLSRVFDEAIKDKTGIVADVIFKLYPTLNPNELNPDNNTSALAKCILLGNLKTFKRCVWANVDLNFLDKSGRTPLDYAREVLENQTVNHEAIRIIIRVLNRNHAKEASEISLLANSRRSHI